MIGVLRATGPNVLWIAVTDLAGITAITNLNYQPGCGIPLQFLLDEWRGAELKNELSRARI
jgi:hypothetical protein